VGWFDASQEEQQALVAAPDTAARLACYFSTAPQFWMNLQVQYDLEEFEASDEAAELARDVQPRKGATA
jgi:plasmid maintenance system antidote protein VapI